MRVGPYETLETLGQGGFGAVYRARHAASKREVALKVLSGGRDRERFAREGEMLAQLRHPNLIEVYESGLDAGRSYLALELVRGEALSEVLPRGPLTEDETVWVVRGLLQGLRHAHQRRIVHRDIKPANLLLCEDASDVRVKLVDFGIAFNDEYTRQLTATGSIIGTMRYLAPELLRGEGCSPASDLWSVGILALECLTGRRAYELSDNQLVQGILSGPPKQLSAIRSMRLHAFVARLLAPTASRSRTCDEALRLLERAAAGRVDTPRRPEAPTLQGFKIDRTPSGRSGNAFETRLATTLGHAAAPAAFDRSALRESAPTALGRPGRVTPTALERPADGSARTTLERPADKGVPTAVERPARGPSTSPVYSAPPRAPVGPPPAESAKWVSMPPGEVRAEGSAPGPGTTSPLTGVVLTLVVGLVAAFAVGVLVWTLAVAPDETRSSSAPNETPAPGTRDVAVTVDNASCRTSNMPRHMLQRWVERVVTMPCDADATFTIASAPGEGLAFTGLSQTLGRDLIAARLPAPPEPIRCRLICRDVR